MATVDDFNLTIPLLGNQSYTSPVVDFLRFNTLSTASFYNTTDASQTTQQIIYQFSAEPNDNFNFNEVVLMRLNEGVSKSFPIRARYGRFVITNTSSTNMSELRLSSQAFEEIQEVGINQVVNLEQTLQAEDERITEEIANRIAGDLNLQNQVFLKANQTDLDTEISNRQSADIDLQNSVNELDINLNLKANQADLDIENQARVSGDITLENSINLTNANLDTEISNRQTADNTLQQNINLKLNITDSIHSNLSFYANQSDNLTNILSNITAPGSTLSLGSGSFGNLEIPLSIDKQNMCIYAQPSSPPITEILSPTTIIGDRIRLRFITFDADCSLHASRSVYTNCSFTENVIVGQSVNGYITFRNCEFVANKTLTISSSFSNVMFFVNCNFGNATIACNQQSSSQVIFTNCANFFAFPPNATYIGLNVLPSGYSKNNVSKTVDSTGSSGNSGDVLTSGGENGLDFWLPLPTSPPIPASGKCLEMICLYPSGQQITSVRNDTLTFQNPVASQSLPQSPFTVLEGSQVQYRPPVGTKTLIYTFYTQASNRLNISSPQDAEFVFKYGNTDVANSRTFINVGQALAYGYIEFSVILIIDANQTENISNGVLSSFDNLTFLRFVGKRLTQNGVFLINNKCGFEPFSNPDFSRPRLRIEAYA
jgi:hypothetical protein